MCCGKARPGRSATPLEHRRAYVIFQYVGRTALTVNGTATGVRYRFERPGTRLIVDARDRRALATIPVLRALG